MPSPVDVRHGSDDDEHDHLVNAINAKAHSLSPPPPHHRTKRPHTSSSPTPHRSVIHPASPFPLSSSLPLPPPPPSLDASASSPVEAAVRRDEQFLLIHKLDRKALALLSPPHPLPPPAVPLMADPPSASSSDSSAVPFGRLALALELLYHSLTCKRALYGEESTPVLSHVEFIVTALNCTAITALRSLQSAHLAHLTASPSSPSSPSKEHRQRAKQLRASLRAWPLTWLKDAEALCLAHPTLTHCHAQTLHHLALTYRLLHKPVTACRLLQQALHTLTTDEATPSYPSDSVALLRSRALLSLDLTALLAQQTHWEQAGLQAREAAHTAQQLVLALVRREGEGGWEEEGVGVSLAESVGLLQTAYRVLGRVEERLHAVGCVRWWERAAELEERMEGEVDEGKREGDDVREMVERVRERVQQAESERRKEREQLLAKRGVWRVVTERNNGKAVDGSSKRARKPGKGRTEDSDERARSASQLSAHS